jgi:hypothetical protein
MILVFTGWLYDRCCRNLVLILKREKLISTYYCRSISVVKNWPGPGALVISPDCDRLNQLQRSGISTEHQYKTKTPALNPLGGMMPSHAKPVTNATAARAKATDSR